MINQRSFLRFYDRDSLEDLFTILLHEYSRGSFLEDKGTDYPSLLEGYLSIIQIIALNDFILEVQLGSDGTNDQKDFYKTYI